LLNIWLLLEEELEVAQQLPMVEEVLEEVLEGI
jgi:hypothetical protein